MSDLYSALKRAGLATKLSDTVFAAGGQIARNALQVYLGDSAQALQFDEPGLAQVQAAAHLAPFGWGEQTMQDTAVRDTWEVNGSALQLAWQAGAEQNLAEQVSRALCLPETLNFSLSLHKLLLYKPGQFFKPHTDSEKAPGMLATLVLVLPSAHRGGLLQVNHGKLQQTFASELMQPGQSNWFAFYADCPHQVLPVESGNRVVLTFNLLVGAPELTQYLPEGSDTQTNLQTSFNEYFLNETMPLAIQLSHRYSKSGLNWGLLKGRDIVAVATIKAIAKQRGWQVWLAQMRKQTSHRMDELGEFDEFNVSEYWREEVMLYHFTSESGVSVPEWCRVKESDFRRDLIFYTEASENWSQDDEAVYTGWSGNEGQMVTSWYNAAALVITNNEGIPPALAYYLASSQPELLRQLRPRLTQEGVEYYLSNEFSFNALSLIPAKQILALSLKLDQEASAITMLSNLKLYRIPQEACSDFVALWKKWGSEFIVRAFLNNDTDDYHSTASTTVDLFLLSLVKMELPGDLINQLVDKVLEQGRAYTTWYFDFEYKDGLMQKESITLNDWRYANVSWAQTMASCVMAGYHFKQFEKTRSLFDKVISQAEESLLEFAEAWLLKFDSAMPAVDFGWEMQHRLNFRLSQLFDKTEYRQRGFPLHISCSTDNRESTCMECSELQKFVSEERIETTLTTTPMKAAHMVEQIAFYRLPIASRLQEDGRNSQFQMTKTPQLQIDLADRRQRMQRCIAEFQRRSISAGQA